MPIGLLVPVVLVRWGTACALTHWRRLGGLARVPALVTNELPFLAGYLLIASWPLRWHRAILIRRAESSSESRRSSCASGLP